MRVRAKFFDGVSSRARAVELDFSSDGSLSIAGEGVDLRVERGGATVDSRLGNAGRFVRLANGGRCEVAGEDSDLLDAALANWKGRGRGRFLHRLESSWKMVLVSAAVLLAAGAGTVYFGMPALARTLAFALSDPVVESLGRNALEYLDKGFFAPSALSDERQAELQEVFGKFLKGSEKRRRVVFRAGGKLGANAFALPSGDIVLTDELVRLARNHDELLAVLAHECGHVERRHALRSVIQASTLATVVSFAVGDASAVASIAGAVPLFLVQSKFSRGFEEEADLYAVRRLREEGISPARLAEILERLAEKHGESEAAWVAYVSSHPPTSERKRVILEAGDGE